MARIIIHGNIKPTEAFYSFLERKIRKIESFTKGFGEGVIIRLEISRATSHHKKGRVFRAEINCDIPGMKTKMIRTESINWKLQLAVEEATKDMIRQLKEFKRLLSAKYKKGAREFKQRIRTGDKNEYI